VYVTSSLEMLFSATPEVSSHADQVSATSTDVG